MSWITPPVTTVGEVLTAATLNTYAADLTVLETSVGLLGAGGALFGTTPSVGTPVFYIQGGYNNAATISAGEYTQVFPTPFPNGVLTGWVNPVSSTEQSATLRTSAGGTTAAQMVISFWTGTSASTGTALFTWGAIGF